MSDVDSFASTVVRPLDTAVVLFDPATATLASILAAATAAAGSRAGALKSVGLMTAPLGPGQPPCLPLAAACSPGGLSEEALRSGPELRAFAHALGALLAPWGRLHILSADVLPRGAGLVQALREAAGRPVAAGRGRTQDSEFSLQDEEGGEAFSCLHVYFLRARLEQWRSGGGAAAAGEDPLADVQAALADKDNHERATTVFDSLPFFYSVVMASFLSIFTPQLCGASQCSFAQKLQPSQLSPLRAATLVLNCATCALLLAVHSAYLWRENFCIKFLDDDDNEPYLNLATGDFADAFPQFEARLRAHNRRCTVLSIVALAALLANFGLSTALLIGFHSEGQATVISMISSSLLLILQTREAFLICRRSYTHPDGQLAISLVRRVPVSYNIVDKDYEEQRRPAGAAADDAGAADGDDEGHVHVDDWGLRWVLPASPPAGGGASPRGGGRVH